MIWKSFYSQLTFRLHDLVNCSHITYLCLLLFRLGHLSLLAISLKEYCVILLVFSVALFCNFSNSSRSFLRCTEQSCPWKSECVYTNFYTSEIMLSVLLAIIGKGTENNCCLFSCLCMFSWWFWRIGSSGFKISFVIVTALVSYTNILQIPGKWQAMNDTQYQLVVIPFIKTSLCFINVGFDFAYFFFL